MVLPNKQKTAEISHILGDDSGFLILGPWVRIPPGTPLSESRNANGGNWGQLIGTEYLMAEDAILIGEVAVRGTTIDGAALGLPTPQVVE
jgi:hypothetical protein